MLVGLMSAKGAPGVTTTALCLVAAAGADGVLVEADPGGGDLECWCGPHGEAGLVGLATRLRPGLTGSDLGRHVVEAVGGVGAVTAPTGGSAAEAALVNAGERLGATLAGTGVDVVADLGRWSPTQTTAGRVAGAGLVGVVCRPSLDSIEHTRALLASLVRAVDAPVGLVVVGGDRPYGPGEIAGALGVGVLGVLPWEPPAVVGLVAGGVGDRAWRRSRLAAAATELAEAAGLMGVRAGA